MLKLSSFKVIQDQLENIHKLCQEVLITLVSYPVIILINAIFMPYRFILDIILRVKLRQKYGGLVPIQDSMFFRKDKSKLIIHSVFILKSNTKRDLFNETKKLLQEKIFDSADYPKFKATIGTLGGYPYIIKDAYNINECVTQLQIPEHVTGDEEYFKELAASLINKPLPQNDAALWEFLISEKPLKGIDDGFYHYPIITRIHHSIGDGTSLMAFLLRVLGEKEAENYSIDLFSKIFGRSQEKTSFLKTTDLNLWQVMKHFIFTWFVGIGRLVKNELKPMEENGLHGPALTGEKIVAWSGEDNVKFLPLVKSIKARLDTKFLNVIMTAISASLTDYLKRNSFPVPPSMTVFAAAILSFPTMDKSKPVPLENKATTMIFDVATHSNDSLIGTLEKISKSNGKLNPADVAVYRWFFKRMGILPTNLLSFIAKFAKPTFAISNVPGGGQVKLLNGCVLEKLIPVLQNLGRMGLVFGILTYDNRFQLELTVDKALIKSQKEAQKIIDDVFYYITLLDEETKALEKK